MPVGRGQASHGKLKALARAWAKPGSRGGGKAVEGDPYADAITAHLAKRKATAAQAQIEVPPDEVEAMTLFFSMATQWRWLAAPGAGMGAGLMIRTGLDYAALASVAAAMAISMTPSLMFDIREMEAAAMAAWAT